jgi:benzoate membrane transport protein
MIIFSLSIVGFMALERVVPPAFIALVSGMAMVDVILSGFMRAFAGRFRFGALFAFIVTATAFTKPISFLKIGPAFWGLVAGVLVTLLLDRGDFKKLRQEQKAKLAEMDKLKAAMTTARA